MKKRTLILVGFVVVMLALLGMSQSQKPLPTEVWVYTAYWTPDFTQPVDMRPAAYAGLKVRGVEPNGWLRVLNYFGAAEERMGETPTFMYVPPNYVTACPIGAVLYPKTAWQFWDQTREVVPVIGAATVVGCENLETFQVETREGTYWVPANSFLIQG